MTATKEPSPKRTQDLSQQNIFDLRYLKFENSWEKRTPLVRYNLGDKWSYKIGKCFLHYSRFYDNSLNYDF